MVDYLIRHDNDYAARNESVVQPGVNVEHNFLRVMFRLKEDGTKPAKELKLISKAGSICTGMLDRSEAKNQNQLVDLFERVKASVASLKLATRVRQDLEFTVKALGASQVQVNNLLKEGVKPINGTNVVIGIIDFGCDFQHRNFRNEDGSSRILYLWDQSAGADDSGERSPQPYNYGREIDKAELDIALRYSDPYQRLFYAPAMAAHGTHVMDIAAGNGLGTGTPGVAPGADVVFVHLNANNANEPSSFANSANVMDAAHYIFKKADKLGLPCVINISLGTRGGAKDGSTLVEQGLDALLKDRTDRSVVVSAGNYRNKHVHTHSNSTIKRNSFNWEVFSGDKTDNELQIWYNKNDSTEVTLMMPNEREEECEGLQIGPVGPDNVIVIQYEVDPHAEDEKDRSVAIGRIIHRENDPNNHKNEINIVLYGLDSYQGSKINESLRSKLNNLMAGNWTVKLCGPNDFSYDAWIERDREAYCSKIAEKDATEECTLNSIGTGIRTISVGAYSLGTAGKPAMVYSGMGPSRNQAMSHKPSIIAPGQRLVNRGITAAAARTQGEIEMSGTSMAAPHITGLIALIMQKNGKVDLDLLRNAASNGEWNEIEGYGRLDALKLLSQIIPEEERIEKPIKTDTSFINRSDELEEELNIHEDTNLLTNRIIGSPVPDWKPIWQISEYPWRCICYLEMSFGSDIRYGTGFLINPRLVLTAAHNLVGSNGMYADKIKVSPGYSLSSNSQYQWSQRFQTSSAYAYDRSIANDYGVIFLDNSFQGNLGHFGLSTYDDIRIKNFYLNIAGYPRFKSYSHRLYHQWGKSKSLSSEYIEYDMDTEVGFSGAPVFIGLEDKWIAVGIHSKGNIRGNKSVRVNSKMIKSVKKWIREL